MKIGIIFSERDWTAAEIALKLQSLAYSNDIDCYISPKHIERNHDKVLLTLNKCDYIIFIAHDIDEPDNITQQELKFLKNKPILGIVINHFKSNISFFKEFRYSLKEDAISYLQSEIQKLKHHTTKSKKHQQEDTLLLLGLTALLIILFLGLSKKAK